MGAELGDRAQAKALKAIPREEGGGREEVREEGKGGMKGKGRQEGYERKERVGE